MSKKIFGAKMFLLATALIVLLAPLAQAQQSPVRPGGMRVGPHSVEDAGAYMDARIAALKAGLRLSAEQDKLWPPFEQAYRDLAKLRIERRSGRDDAAPPSDPVARLARQADALSSHGAALKRLADAAAPLYQSLDDAQKQRFVVLSRLMGRHHRSGMMQQGPGRSDGWNQRERGRDLR